MSLLKVKRIYSLRRLIATSGSGLSAAWNKDWKPGPYPKTPEERKAAAKKYGLFEEEYVPTPDDGHGSGDYPYFKPYSVESRDPFYPWDMPEYRRNYGEAIIEDFDMYTEDRLNINKKHRYSWTVMIGSFLGTMGLSYALYTLGEDLWLQPVLAPHMPRPGVTHYKYESPGK